MSNWKMKWTFSHYFAMIFPIRQIRQNVEDYEMRIVIKSVLRKMYKCRSEGQKMYNLSSTSSK